MDEVPLEQIGVSAQELPRWLQKRLRGWNVKPRTTKHGLQVRAQKGAARADMIIHGDPPVMRYAVQDLSSTVVVIVPAVLGVQVAQAMLPLGSITAAAIGGGVGGLVGFLLATPLRRRATRRFRDALGLDKLAKQPAPRAAARRSR